MRLRIKQANRYPIAVTAALLTVLSATINICCRFPKKAYLDKGEFEKWFVESGDNVGYNMLYAASNGIDSIVRSIRHESVCGKGRVILKDSAGDDYIVGFMTPPVIRGDTVYPCVIYLHGGTGTERRDKGDSAYLMLDMLADSMELFLVSPSADRKAPWWSGTGLRRILQTLRYFTLHYPIDAKKVFLVGVSDGATGCWAAANTIAAPFAGFIAISGFGGLLPQLGMELFPENLMQRPIYNVNAGKDRLYPIAVVNRFLDYMEERGVNVKRKVYPDEEHGFDYRFKEAASLCGIIRNWSLGIDSCCFRWKGNLSYPALINHIAENEPEPNTESFSVHGFYRSDTFFIYSSGLRRIKLYFQHDDVCMRHSLFLINDKKRRFIKPIKNDKKMKLFLMKQLCFPNIPEMVFYSIEL